MAKQSATIEKPLEITPDALEVVLEKRSLEDDPTDNALKIMVIGSTITDYKYSLELIPKDEIDNSDLTYSQGEFDEITVVIPQDSIKALDGAKLDTARGPQQGLLIKNPNKPNPIEGMDIELGDDLEENVKLVLDSGINPSLAAHGGYAELVKVEGNKVFITMGGGCQGCSASAMTLSNGIKAMLKNALPEIEDVVDVTDHESGENPFYS